MCVRERAIERDKGRARDSQWSQTTSSPVTPVPLLSVTMYLFISFRMSTLPQNRQLHVLISGESRFCGGVDFLKLIAKYVLGYEYSLRRTGVHCTCGLISTCRSRDCVESLRSAKPLCSFCVSVRECVCVGGGARERESERESERERGRARERKGESSRQGPRRVRGRGRGHTFKCFNAFLL